MGVLTKLFFYKARPIPMGTTTFWKRLNAGSFPSLHTITATIVAMVVFRGTIEFGFSQYIFLLYMIIAMAVALSRIALKKHYPTDVFFGMIYGVVGVFMVLYGGIALLIGILHILRFTIYN
jgi:membrane-associated phospholipid phosphatase